MRITMSRTIKYGKLLPVLTLIALLISTDPEKGTFWIFIIFLLIGLVMYQLLRFFMSRVMRRTVSRAPLVVIATMVLLLVALQSLGQLNSIDASLIVVLSLSLAFYLARYNVHPL
jgi:hypothetical protein